VTAMNSTSRSPLKTIALHCAGVLLVLLFHGCAARTSSPGTIRPTAQPHEDNAARPSNNEVSGTFSIVAVDPQTGNNPDWGKTALDLLAQGNLPEQVLAELLRDDPRRDKRQLAIIDMTGRAANRNPANADPSGFWWGAASGKYYACQGNTLTGREVVFAMARAYEQTKGSLADRLMAALLAADCAGGDHRGRLAAGIRIAKKGIQGHWLELYVDDSDDAVIELAKKYAALKHNAKGPWPGAKPPFKHPCPNRTKPAPQPKTNKK